MSRNGSGTYTLPSGSIVTNGDTSDASDLNTPLQDLEADANTPRPIVAGGTGGASAAVARANLGLGIGSNVQAYDATLQTIASQGNVGTNEIATGAVTAEKIADGVIPDGTIDDGAVTIEKIDPAALVTESEGINSNDNDITIPTSAAAKKYTDSSVDTMNGRQSGDAPTYAARAWGSFSASGGTVSINGSGNIATITRVSTGVYDVTFTDAMPSSGYAPVISAWDTGTSGIDIGAFNLSASGFRIAAEGGGGSSTSDPDNVHFAVFI